MNRPADSERQATVLTSLNQALHDLMVQEPRVFSLLLGDSATMPRVLWAVELLWVA